MSRYEHFQSRADDRGHLRAANVFRGKNALYDEEVGRPIAHRNYGAEAEDDSDPVDAHRVGRKDPSVDQR